MTMRSRFSKLMANVSALTFKDSRRKIYSKPPRDKIGPAQSFLVLSVFAAAIMTPAGWILSHLPEYRNRTLRNPRN